MTVAPAVTIAPETPDQPDVLPLFKANNAYMASLYPAESNHGLSLQDLLKPPSPSLSRVRTAWRSVAARGRQGRVCRA